MKNWKQSLKNFFSLKTGSATSEEIYAQAQDGAQIKGANMFILICAIIVASVGLNMNSTAVVIGAMLISPLMGGIISMAYGFATNDVRHTRNAALKFALQIGISLVASFIYFKLSPISTADSELLSRTTPTIWDVLIATFAGFAGVIGITRKEKTNVIPGVAIATALMPPLCTAGYGLAVGSMTYFLGAFYLFFINTFFICITSVIVFRALHIPVKVYQNDKSRRRSRIIIAIVAIITIIPSIYFGYGIAADSIMQANYQNYVKTEFNFEDTQVVSSKLDMNQNLIEVALVGKTLDDSQIQELANKLPDYSLPSMTLRVNQTKYNTGISKTDVEALIQQSAQNTGKDNTGIQTELQNTLSNYQSQLLESQANDLDMLTISTELKALFPQIDSCAGAILSLPGEDGKITMNSVILAVHSTSPLTDGQKAQIESWIKQKTGKQSVYLYESDTPITESTIQASPQPSAADPSPTSSATEVTPAPAS
ncbi:MAG: TIGR00341 family protein [Christensenella sp.]|nr:TIGR00341 family protein [Christensenella sp.]